MLRAAAGPATPRCHPALLTHTSAGLLWSNPPGRLLLSCRVPLLALEYKHVSMRLCSVIPSADEVAEAAVAAMDAHGLAQGCVVAHSYGTFVASRMAQRHPGRMQSLALLDPVW